MHILSKDASSKLTARPLGIVGPGVRAVDTALKKTLRAKRRGQPLIILDYRGYAAQILGESNKGNLHKSPVLWCDLSNRQKPVALFQFDRTVDFRASLHAFLSDIVKTYRSQVDDAAVKWTVDLAWNLSDQGTVTLASILRGLMRPEIQQWFAAQAVNSAHVSRFTGLLDWMIRFPSVWAMTEASNRVDMLKSMREGATIWIEIPFEHLEQAEYRIIARMAETAIKLALDGLRAGNTPLSNQHREPALLLYVFPRDTPLCMSPSRDNGSYIEKHMGVFAPGGDQRLPPALDAWIGAGAELWVLAGVGRLKGGALSRAIADSDMTNIAKLQDGQIWVRPGRGAGVVMKTSNDRPAATPAQLHRRASLKTRRIQPIRQFSTALSTAKPQTLGNVGLYEKLCHKEALRAGWFRVSTGDRNSHGVDGVTVDQFKQNLDRELERLSNELSSYRYRPRPLRRIYIPKSNGEKRPIGVSSVRDRVVQSACLQLLEPIFEPRFSHYSFAFRPRRNAHNAIALSRAMIGAGRSWVVTADIRKCFDSIDHDVLLRLVGESIGDQDLMNLIHRWISTDVIDFTDIEAVESGVPQGDSLSPLLSNVYLTPMDRHFERLGVVFVRYADDIVIFANMEDDAKNALKIMEEFLRGVLHLALKPTKTYYTKISDGFDFLGFRITDTDLSIQQDRLARVHRETTDALLAIGRDDSPLIKRANDFARYNSIIRGFRNYFLIENTASIMGQLRALDERLLEAARRILPASVLNDPSWAMRERFAHASAQNIETSDSQPCASPDAYPHESDARNPSPWCVKDSQAESVNRVATNADPKSTILSAGASTDASEVVQHSGRVYIIGHGCYVTHADKKLIVRKRKKTVFEHDLDETSLICLYGIRVSVSAELVLQAGEMDIPIVFAPPWQSTISVLSPLKTTRSRIREQQILRRNDPDVMKTGMAMLATKLGNQASVLKYFARYRKNADTDLYKQLTEAADQVRNQAQALKALDPCAADARTSAMGHEGHGASIYWSTLAKLMPQSMEFRARHTRFAADPVNQTINYVYGLLYGEVWRALAKIGLDPYFGIIHGSERNHGSLVFDLIEEFRAPFGDRMVLSMLGRGFHPELAKDGYLRVKTCRLLASGFARTWNKKIRWLGKMIAPAEILEQQAASLVEVFVKRGAYHSFQFRW